MSQLAESVGKNGPLLNDKLLLMASVCWLARTLMSFYPPCGIYPPFSGETKGRKGVGLPRVLRAPLIPTSLIFVTLNFFARPIFVTDICLLCRSLETRREIHLIRANNSVRYDTFQLMLRS